MNYCLIDTEKYVYLICVDNVAFIHISIPVLGMALQTCIIEYVCTFLRLIINTKGHFDYILKAKN